MLYCLTEHFGSVQPPKCIFGSMTKCCCQHIENKADDTSPSVSLLPAPCCIPLHLQPRMDGVIVCFIVLYFKAEFLAFSCHPCSFQNNLVAVDKLQTNGHTTLLMSEADFTISVEVCWIGFCLLYFYSANTHQNHSGLAAVYIGKSVTGGYLLWLSNMLLYKPDNVWTSWSCH